MKIDEKVFCSLIVRYFAVCSEVNILNTLRDSMLTCNSLVF